MILKLSFLLGLTCGVIAGLIVGYMIFHEDDFDKRQKRYRRMI